MPEARDHAQSKLGATPTMRARARNHLYEHERPEHERTADQINMTGSSRLYRFVLVDVVLLALNVVVVVLLFTWTMLLALAPFLALLLSRCLTFGTFWLALRRSSRPFRPTKLFSTLPNAHSHLRTSAMLSYYPPLQSWYLQTLALAPVALALCLLVAFVRLMVGGLDLARALVLVALAYAQYRVVRRTLRSFVWQCVRRPIEETLYSSNRKTRFTAQLARERVARQLAVLDADLQLGCEAPVYCDAASAKRGAHDDRDGGKKRKKRGDRR